MTASTIDDNTQAAQHAVDGLVAAYQALTPHSLPKLLSFYDERAHFKDPFNDVNGRDEIERIFRHMYATLTAPTFSVHHSFVAPSHAMLLWTFRFELAQQQFVVPGSTALRFDAAGLIVEHVDYWDPTEHVWAQLPWLGGLVRWLRRRFSSAHFRAAQ